MPELVLGPKLRYVGETEATVWVEVDAPCEVEVLGHRAPTFCVAGHHYALVTIRGLEPGSWTPYEVALDGERVWPLSGSEFPPSVIATLARGRPARIVFGSCRVAAPHEPPYSLSPDEHELGREVDALWAYALRLRGRPREELPNLLLMLGDQVYADELAPRTREFIRGRRDVSKPPHEEVLDFEEYTHLYREAWSDPPIRWLFSTVSTAAIFDDHDVHDDWNISLAWLEDMRAREWWNVRIVAALSSYWVYQHLGNLPPDELEANELLRRVREADDGAEALAEFAYEADRTTEAAIWSFARELGGARVVVVDSRAGRVVGERREMIDDEEWKWLEGQATGGVDHLVVATSLPFLLPHGPHGLEQWNEATAAGAWGSWFVPRAERIRRRLDLEHWAAFGSSFERLAGILRDVATGRRGAAPASVLVLSGDVHYSYLAEVESPGAPIVQATTSPFRNPLNRRIRLLGRFAASRAGSAVGEALRLSARAPRPSLRWRVVRGPWFDNVVGTLYLDGPRATLTMEKTLRDSAAEPVLETVYEHRLETA